MWWLFVRLLEWLPDVQEDVGWIKDQTVKLLNYVLSHGRSNVSQQLEARWATAHEQTLNREQQNLKKVCGKAERHRAHSMVQTDIFDHWLSSKSLTCNSHGSWLYLRLVNLFLSLCDAPFNICGMKRKFAIFSHQNRLHKKKIINMSTRVKLKMQTFYFNLRDSCPHQMNRAGLFIRTLNLSDQNWLVKPTI